LEPNPGKEGDEKARARFGWRQMAFCEVVRRAAASGELPVLAIWRAGAEPREERIPADAFAKRFTSLAIFSGSAHRLGLDADANWLASAALCFRRSDFDQWRAPVSPRPLSPRARRGAAVAIDENTSEDAALAWLAEEMGRRRRSSESRLRDDVVQALRVDHPEIGERKARELFKRLPRELKTGRGRKAGGGNSGQI
jgi:hypothetical protein